MIIIILGETQKGKKLYKTAHPIPKAQCLASRLLLIFDRKSMKICTKIGMFSVLSSNDQNKRSLVTRILKLQGFSNMVVQLLFFTPKFRHVKMQTNVLRPASFSQCLQNVNEQTVLLSAAQRFTHARNRFCSLGIILVVRYSPNIQK